MLFHYYYSLFHVIRHSDIKWWRPARSSKYRQLDQAIGCYQAFSLQWNSTLRPDVLKVSFSWVSKNVICFYRNETVRLFVNVLFGEVFWETHFSKIACLERFCQLSILFDNFFLNQTIVSSVSFINCFYLMVFKIIYRFTDLIFKCFMVVIRSVLFVGLTDLQTDVIFRYHFLFCWYIISFILL